MDNRHVSGERVMFTTEIAQQDEIIGQDHLVQLQTERIGGQITAVSFNQVTMDVTFGDPNRLPRRGDIAISTVAAQRALTHQTQAVDAVMFGRSISEELKPLILQPSTAVSAAPVSGVTPMDGDFDEEKIAILAHPPQRDVGALMSSARGLWTMQTPANGVVQAQCVRANAGGAVAAPQIPGSSKQNRPSTLPNQRRSAFASLRD